MLLKIFKKIYDNFPSSHKPNKKHQHHYSMLMLNIHPSTASFCFITSRTASRMNSRPRVVSMQRS